MRLVPSPDIVPLSPDKRPRLIPKSRGISWFFFSKFEFGSLGFRRPQDPNDRITSAENNSHNKFEYIIIMTFINH